jgi:AmmeMemoRadiSam system protein B
MDYPKLRPVNVFPVQTSGRTVVCLQDPHNVSEKTLFLPPALYFIVSCFDGCHSILDIQAEYMRGSGQFLYREKVEEIIQQLDENLFLEGDHFREALHQVEERFRGASVREAVFAGKSYESDPGELRAQLEGYFVGPQGPGPLRVPSNQDGLQGLIAPHIDYQRGGFCYAHAHRELWERGTSRTFIIFGTAHHPMGHPFCLTRKDFLTPLGRLEADQSLIDGIQSRCPYDLFGEERVHRSEHSIEFQCVFLRYLFPEPHPIKIVPILSGSFHEAIAKGVSPLEMEPIRQFVDALKQTLQTYPAPVCCVASADLAHLGVQFGDTEGMGEYELRMLEAEDQEMLGWVERLDPEGFYRSIMKDRDRRRICGFPAIYTMLNVMEVRKGKLLKYGQAFTAETQSVVSFASLAFYR